MFNYLDIAARFGVYQYLLEELVPVGDVVEELAGIDKVEIVIWVCLAKVEIINLK